MRPAKLCLERLDRLTDVFDRQGGSETLRKLVRNFSLCEWEITQAAELGWVAIEVRKPPTGSPSGGDALPWGLLWQGCLISTEGLELSRFAKPASQVDAPDMKARSSLPDRLKAMADGLGEASQTDVDRRAAELAHIDGREVFTDEDLAKAAAELGATRNSGEAGLWDEPADDQGKHTKRGSLENDANLGEQLTRQGMADADHDQRLAAFEGDSDR